MLTIVKILCGMLCLLLLCSCGKPVDANNNATNLAPPSQGVDLQQLGVQEGDVEFTLGATTDTTKEPDIDETIITPEPPVVNNDETQATLPSELDVDDMQATLSNEPDVDEEHASAVEPTEENRYPNTGIFLEDD